MDWIDDKGSPGMPGKHLALQPYFGLAPTGRYESDGHGRVEPQAFLVESGPDNEPLRTHFHTVNQFQYIAHGRGSVGRHEVEPGIVHYADRYTPYGPLRSGPDGLAYLTLRATTDMGISYMPDERDQLADELDRNQIDASARRNITLDLRADPATPAGGWVDMVNEDDELRVATAVVPAEADLAMGPAGGTGAFVLVVAGTVDGGGARHSAGALAWCPAGESMAATAGETGARVAWLQLPLSTRGQ
jgi:hypothetical protein